MITVNGKELNKAKGKNILELLEMLKLDYEKVVVEINYEIIQKDKFSNILIKDNDKVEVLSFVGGG